MEDYVARTSALERTPQDRQQSLFDLKAKLSR